MQFSTQFIKIVDLGGTAPDASPPPQGFPWWGNGDPHELCVPPQNLKIAPPLTLLIMTKVF